MNNKENTLSALRTGKHNENSSIKNQDSLKSSVKSNVTSRQTRSKTNYVKIDINENAKENVAKEKNTKDKSNKDKNEKDKSNKPQSTVKKTFAELNRSASPTTGPILTKGTKKADFQIETEQLRSEAVLVEPTSVSKYKSEITLHHKVIKPLHVSEAVVETTNADVLIKKLNHLKQQKEAKENKLQEIRQKKQAITRTRATVKSRIHKLKEEIKEQEELKKELLSIITPIEENASRAESVKQKQDLVEELLNNLSFLHYQIEELKEQKA